MLQFFDDSSVDLANRVISQPEVVPSWINMGVLAQLGIFKAELEEKVLSLSEQGTSGLWSDSDLAIEYPATRVIDFWQRLNGSEVAEHADAVALDGTRETLYIDFLVATSCPEDHLECPTKLGMSSPEALYSTEPAVSIVSGRCRRCFWGGGLVERQVPYGCFALASYECPVCGCAGGGSGLLDFIPIAEPFFRLARAVLREVLARYQDLLRRIITAVAVLLSRLKRSAFRFAIATSQRSFFACHGAHPPRTQPSPAPGLFSGMAFQPTVAA